MLITWMLPIYGLETERINNVVPDQNLVSPVTLERDCIGPNDSVLVWSVYLY